MKKRKELEIKYKVMQEKPNINQNSKSLINNRSSFIERSQKDLIERNERKTKLVEKHKNVDEEKELTFHPNQHLRAK